MKDERVRKYLILGAIVIGIAILVYFKKSASIASFSDQPVFSDAAVETEVLRTAAVLTVYLTGEVRDPGVYLVEEDTRLYELIEKAGGFTESADQGALNLAMVLQDGMHVRVPAKSASNETSGSGKVNVNTAGKDDLLTLPGIGAAKAEAIIRYREANGWFLSPEDLLNVPGIGESVLFSIQEHIEF